MALRLPRLPSGFKIINSDGSATNDFQIWWGNVAGQTEAAINGIQTALEAAGIALDAAAAAQAAADAANTAAENAQNTTDAQKAEASIVNSGVINEVGPLQASAAGLVTVTNHERRYGDPTLNPTVSVTGGGGVSGFVPDDTVYVYYDDPTRAGGAVTYQFTTDVGTAAQGGNRHTVGAVVVPMAGTQDGTYTRPPGIVP